MLVLDTDHVSALEFRDSPEGERLRARLDRAPTEQFATTIISYEEQIRGRLAPVAKARSMAERVEAYRRLRRQFDNYREIVLIDFDEACAVEFQRLQRERIRIGTKDLMIAAIVLRHDATLLSRNLRDFCKVPGLKVEDWTL